MPPPLQIDLLAFESGVRVTCDVGYLSVFLGLSVLDVDPIYATDRRQTYIIA